MINQNNVDTNIDKFTGLTKLISIDFRIKELSLSDCTKEEPEVITEIVDAPSNHNLPNTTTWTRETDDDDEEEVRNINEK
jgi:hypothetical protein